LLAKGSKPLTDDEQLYLRLLELGECIFLIPVKMHVRHARVYIMVSNALR